MGIIARSVQRAGELGRGPARRRGGHGRTVLGNGGRGGVVEGGYGRRRRTTMGENVIRIPSVLGRHWVWVHTMGHRRV